MTKDTKTPAAAVGTDASPDTAAIDHQTEVGLARAEGFDDGHDKGVAAERERVTGILGMAPAGQEMLAREMIADGTPRAAAAERFLKAANDARADQVGDAAALAAVAGAETATGGVAADTVAGGHAGKPAKAEADMSDDELKAAWQASAELRKEYAAADIYVGYVRGRAAGAFRD